MIVYAMQTAFLAMSGGLDSSFCAHLLKQQGYKVVGITFALLPKDLPNPQNPKACCSLESMARARKVADDLSIPHYVFNLRDEFDEHVIQRFVSEYRSGRTPNPCVLCNRYVKFEAFMRKALALGADLIATGHYASVAATQDGWCLKKGRDRSKDQSYFLYPIAREQLPLILFPLANWTKQAVRSNMAVFSRDAASTRESQDICFLPEGDYRSLVAQCAPPKKGKIMLTDGRHLGYHDGLHLYTIGQRRGLNLPFSEPLYVVDIQVDENLLVVGPRTSLLRRGLAADNVNMLCSRTSGRALGRVRYRQKEEPCTYTVKDGRMEVLFDEPVSAITPGQSVVLYEADRVLGGGTVLEVL